MLTTLQERLIQGQLQGPLQRRTERDHELLIEPISAASPAGEWLRYDPLYDQINAARRADDTSLSQGVWQRPAQLADWRLVEELCYTALQTRSKDLQLAVWLTEAWLHLYGVAGISSGCQLIVGLHDTYLVSMFPQPRLVEGPDTQKIGLPLDAHDDAIEHRLNMLQWLNEKLSVEVKLFPLTAPVENSGVPAVSLADIEAAQHRSHAARQPGIPSNQKDPLDAGLACSMSLTPPAQLTQMWIDLNHALDVIQTLSTVLDRDYGEANGGLLHITDALAEMIATISPGLPTDSKTMSPPPASLATCLPTPIHTTMPETQLYATVVRTMKAAVDEANHQDPQPGIRTRDEAYALLAEIADYLARIEPHSPVPYLLQRAIAWGGMSLQELLPELLQDQAALRDVGHLLRLDTNGRGFTN